jgi:hypothetical protein
VGNPLKQADTMLHCKTGTRFLHIPDYETQILSDMYTEIEALEKKLIKRKMTKQGMMQSLLTGRIRLV